MCGGWSLGRGRWCDGWCKGSVDNIRADGINVHSHGPTGRQSGLAMGARKVAFLMIGYNVSVQALLMEDHVTGQVLTGFFPGDLSIKETAMTSSTWH